MARYLERLSFAVEKGGNHLQLDGFRRFDQRLKSRLWSTTRSPKGQTRLTLGHRGTPTPLSEGIVSFPQSCAVLPPRTFSLDGTALSCDSSHKSGTYAPKKRVCETTLPVYCEQMMKVLFISRHPLDMRLGDAVRIVNFARQLRPSCTFDLLCFCKPDQYLSEEVREVFDQVTMLPYPVEQRVTTVWRAARALTLRSVAPVSDAMREAIAARLASGDYDILFSNGASMLLNLPSGPTRLPVVCDSIDSASLTISREWLAASWTQRAHLLRRRWHNYQLSDLLRRRVNANIFASELDAEIFARANPSVRTEGIPNGVDPDYFHPGAESPEPDSIVFEGNMMFGPNIDAALFLCKEIVPLVLRRHPALRVYLVGRDPTKEVSELASENVVVTGTVPDVRPYLWRSSIFVCPMRLGAGIKNKILQAWATGMPVVATPEAMGGLGGRDGENVILRSDPAAIAEAICWLLDDPERGRQIAAGGRDRVLRHYTWAAQADRLDRLFQQVAVSYAQQRSALPTPQ